MVATIIITFAAKGVRERGRGQQVHQNERSEIFGKIGIKIRYTICFEQILEMLFFSKGHPFENLANFLEFSPSN